jgi:quercetin dioxygenase-like cupin family protein
MGEKIIFPNWKDLVIYTEKGMQPHVLVETGNYKSVVAGMAAGNSMPAHSEGPAIFYFLEGSGKMIVEEETLSVQAGSIVVVPDGASRGIESETPLAFLAVRLPH